LMRQFHKPADEKRMIVILPAERYDDWLRAKPEQSLGFLLPYPADKLCVAAESLSTPSHSGQSQITDDLPRSQAINR